MYGLSCLASAPKKPAYRQRAARGFWSRQSIRNVDHEIRDTLDEIALLSGLSILPLETVPLGAIDLRAHFSDTTGSRWRAYMQRSIKTALSCTLTPHTTWVKRVDP
jgi:hypothetical protein